MERKDRWRKYDDCYLNGESAKIENIEGGLNLPTGVKWGRTEWDNRLGRANQKVHKFRTLKNAKDFENEVF